LNKEIGKYRFRGIYYTENQGYITGINTYSQL